MPHIALHFYPFLTFADDYYLEGNHSGDVAIAVRVSDSHTAVSTDAIANITFAPTNRLGFANVVDDSNTKIFTGSGPFELHAGERNIGWIFVFDSTYDSSVDPSGSATLTEGTFNDTTPFDFTKDTANNRYVFRVNDFLQTRTVGSDYKIVAFATANSARTRLVIDIIVVAE